MPKKVIVILAEGFEEIEAVVPIDVLRRAGVEVIVAGLDSKSVSGAHGLRFTADTILDEFKDSADAVFLPGGLPGATNLQKSSQVIEFVKKMNQSGKIISAICASPALALASAGVLAGSKATCYPGFERQFPSDATFVKDRVVSDQNLLTSRGPGTAFEFAFRLVETLVGKPKADELREGMIVAK